MRGDRNLDSQLRGVPRAARSRKGGWVVCALGALVLLGIAALGVQSPPELNVTGFKKGMVLGVFSRHEEGYFRESLKEIRELGANSVSIMIPKVQKTVRSTGFYDDPMVTPSDESLRFATREAHRLGMTVFFLPTVYVEELKKGEWRGTLTPADWTEWFAEYEKMILHYARLAEEEGVEFFSVGSELCSTEGFGERWRKVIDKTRGVFRGHLTYSANWDHLEPVSFGKDLDILGMNAYFEVGRGDKPTVGEMVRQWKQIQPGLRRWQQENGGKPLFITEIGYPSRAGAGRDPWNYLLEAEADPEEQRKCYEAFVRAWKDETILDGVYFYIWWGEGGPRDRDYTPRGKPAQRVIENWYRGQAARP